MNFGIRISLGISISGPAGSSSAIPANALTLGGEPLTLGGEVLTLEDAE